MPDTVHHVMWYTVDAKTGDLIATDMPQKKSLPVRQHGQAKRVMSLAAHHHKNTTTCGKPQGGKT